jgi:hypothetical protein
MPFPHKGLDEFLKMLSPDARKKVVSALAPAVAQNLKISTRIVTDNTGNMVCILCGEKRKDKIVASVFVSNNQPNRGFVYACCLSHHNNEQEMNTIEGMLLSTS